MGIKTRGLSFPKTPPLPMGSLEVIFHQPTVSDPDLISQVLVGLPPLTEAFPLSNVRDELLPMGNTLHRRKRPRLSFNPGIESSGNALGHQEDDVANTYSSDSDLTSQASSSESSLSLSSVSSSKIGPDPAESSDSDSDFGSQSDSSSGSSGGSGYLEYVRENGEQGFDTYHGDSADGSEYGASRSEPSSEAGPSGSPSPLLPPSNVRMFMLCNWKFSTFEPLPWTTAEKDHIEKSPLYIILCDPPVVEFGGIATSKVTLALLPHLTKQDLLSLALTCKSLYRLLNGGHHEIWLGHLSLCITGPCTINNLSYRSKLAGLSKYPLVRVRPPRHDQLNVHQCTRCGRDSCKACMLPESAENIQRLTSLSLRFLCRKHTPIMEVGCGCPFPGICQHDQPSELPTCGCHIGKRPWFCVKCEEVLWERNVKYSYSIEVLTRDEEEESRGRKKTTVTARKLEDGREVEIVDVKPPCFCGQEGEKRRAWCDTCGGRRDERMIFAL